MSNYPVKRLRDVGVALYDCEHKTPKPAEHGYPYIAIPNIQDGRLDLSDVRLITKEDFNFWTRKIKPQAGDIIVTRRGRVGDIAVVPEGLECAIGQNLVILRSDGSEIEQSFLRWALRGPQYDEQVEKFLNVGAIFYSLNCADIPDFELPIPPIPEQHAIAEILGALDDKIELNRRMNATLESMARAVFRQWFMESEKVGNWEEKPLYKCAEYINGAAYRDFDFSSDNSGLPIIKIAEIKNGITDQTKFTNKQMDKKYQINDGDILFAWSGSPDTSIDTFIWSDGQGWLNQHIFKVVPNGSSKKWFTYLLLKDFKEIFIEIARDKQTTGLGHVTVKDLNRLLVAYPPENILSAFSKIVDPIVERIFANLKESRTLASLRNSLLPKLMRGEVMVKDMEKQK